MRVLQPSKNHNQSSMSDKSIADKSVFDFPDDTSDDTGPKLVTKRKNLSRTRMVKRQTDKNKAKENSSTFNLQLTTQPMSENNPICPICRLQFSEDDNEETKAIHVSKCLIIKDTSKPTKMVAEALDQASCSKVTSSSNALVDKTADKPSCSKVIFSEETCPVCGTVFSGDISSREKEIHTNKCLDVSSNGGNLLEQTKSDELLARSLQQGDTTVGPFTEVLDSCQVCLKDLGKLSVGQRMTHLNTCYDKVEVIEGKSTKRKNPNRRVKTTQKRGTKIPRKQCPICKAEQPENKFSVHLKKCAGKHKLSPYQLGKIIQEHQLDLVSEDSSTATVATRSKAISSSTLVKPSEVNLLDQTVVQEHKRLIEQDSNEIEIPTTPALPKSSLTNNSIIANNCQTKKNIKDNPPNKSKSKTPPCRLWTLSAYTMGTLNSVFLVRNLHPVISDVGFSDGKDQTMNEGAVFSPQSHDEIIGNKSLNVSFTATQFEKLNDLLDMGELHDIKENETIKDGFIVDDVDKKIDSLREERSPQEVLSAYHSLIASPVCSDFTFVCGGKEEISAHKVILLARCPFFKKIILEDKETHIELEDQSPTTIKACLLFIYTGELFEENGFNREELEKIISLSKRFGLDELLTYAKLIYSKSKSTNRTGSPFIVRNDDSKANKEVSTEEDEFNLNDIVSSFWHDNDLDADIDDVKESDIGEQNKDDGFSDDEINELREMFISQTVNKGLIATQSIKQTENEAKDKGNKNESRIITNKQTSLELKTTTAQVDRLSEISQLSDNAPDEFFFVPDINKTIERSRCSTDDNQTSNEIESGLLGESPKKRLIPSVTGQSLGANFVIAKSLWNSNTFKSSLEALATDSPKPDLSVGSSKPFIEEYRSSYGSSANADTEPISSATYQASLLDTQSAFNYPKDNSFVSKQRAKKGDSSGSREKSGYHSLSGKENKKGDSLSGIQKKTNDSLNHIENKKDNSFGCDVEKKDDSLIRNEKTQNDSLEISITKTSKINTHNNSSLLEKSKSDLFDSAERILDHSSNTNCKKTEKKQRTSGPVSVLTVPNDEPEVIKLDKTCQDKTHCDEVTIVGSMYFTNAEDYQTFVVKKSGATESTETTKPLGHTEASLDPQMISLASSSRAEQRTILINRDTTTTTTSSETEVEDCHNYRKDQNIGMVSLEDLFPSNAGDEEISMIRGQNNKTDLSVMSNINQTSDITPEPFLCDTPMPFSAETPCRNQSEDDYLSNNSLEDVEIPGLASINMTSINVDCNEDENNSPKELENTVIHKDNKKLPDFEITFSKQNTTLDRTNVILVDDNIKDDIIELPSNLGAIETSVERSPCVTNMEKTDTSTPHISNENATKRHFLKLRQRLHADSPIGPTFEERGNQFDRSKTNNNNKGDEDEPIIISQSTIRTSVLLGEKESTFKAPSSTKRKADSSTESLSSACESNTYGELVASSQQRKYRKRARKTTSLSSKPIKTTPPNRKITVEETSSSSEDDRVSDSATFNSSLHKKSPFISSKRNSPGKSNSGLWLSTLKSPTSAKRSTLSNTKSPFTSKNTSASSKPRRSTRQKKKDQVRNADVKRMLAEASRSESDAEYSEPTVRPTLLKSLDGGDKNKTQRSKKAVISSSDLSSNYGDENKSKTIKEQKKTIISTSELSSDTGDVTIIEESQCSDDGDNTPTKNARSSVNNNSLDIFEANGIQANNTLLEKSVKFSGEDKVIDLEAIDVNPANENPYYGDNDCRYDGGNVDEGGIDVPYHGDNSPNYDGGNISDEKIDVSHDRGNGSKYDGGNVTDAGLDAPYLDDNDVYFMEDGGYNSFVLEMPATDTSLHTSGDKSSSSKLHEKSSTEKSGSLSNVSTEADKYVVILDQLGNDKWENIQTDKEEMVNQNLTSDGSILFDKWPSEIALPDDAEVIGSAQQVKTPQEKGVLKRDFQTPKNPVSRFKHAHPQSDVSCDSTDDEFETPQQKPKDKEACKTFRPGIGLHPETNQAITPMPDFAKYPTPDLKEKMKNFALRETSSKNRMVAKMEEVYKFQHGFSHWQGEPPVKETRKRKTNTTSVKKSSDSEGAASTTTSSETNTKKKTKTFTPVCSVVDENGVEVVKPPKDTKKNNKQPKKQIVTEDEIFLYIQADSQLYQNILSYQPVELNQIIEVIEKATSSIINKTMLEQFIDRQCICLKKEAIASSDGSTQQPRGRGRGRSTRLKKDTSSSSSDQHKGRGRGRVKKK